MTASVARRTGGRPTWFGMEPRRFLMARLALSLGATVLLFSPSLAFADLTTALAGGSGGTEYAGACRPGEAVVGVHGRAGMWIDRLGPQCVKVNSGTGQWEGSPVNRTAVGGTTGTPFTRTCPRDFAIEAFNGIKGQYVNQLIFHCQRLTADMKTSGAIVLMPPIGTAGMPPGTNFNRLACPQDRAATGLFGRSGLYVDSVGLRCLDEGVWRPFVHFAPPTGWMNDPSGLTFANGTFHLYYQAVPGSVTFDPELVAWGHTTSTNLLTWENPGIALSKIRDRFGINRAPYTGSGVVLPGTDPVCTCGDTSSIQCVVAVFTRHSLPAGPQSQALKPSCRTDGFFDRQEREILPNATEPHFRDPKIFRYTDPRNTSRQYWVMVLAAGHRVMLYRSQDLIEWTKLSEIPIYPIPSANGPFVECAELVELPVDNVTGAKKWVLIFGEGYIPIPFPLGRDEPSKTLYLVGDFDGTRFQAEIPNASLRQQLISLAQRLRISASTVEGLTAIVPTRFMAQPFDAGPDLYAAQSWFFSPSIPLSTPLTFSGTIATRSADSPAVDEPVAPGEASQESDREVSTRGLLGTTGNRHIVAGWQSNWQYARLMPTSGWRGQLSIPRELGVTWDEGRHWLTQRPIRELLTARDSAGSLRQSNINLGTTSFTPSFQAAAFEAIVTIAVPPDTQGGADQVRISIRGPGAGQLVVGWRRTDQSRSGLLFLDRRQSWSSTAPIPSGYGSPPGTLQTWETPFSLSDNGTLQLRIIVDTSSVEVFGGDGRAVMSGIFFPNPGTVPISITATGGSARLVNLELYRLLNKNPL